MRFKYYLRGCGLGILLTAIILTIGFHRSGGRMSDEDVMQRASELGMISPEEPAPDMSLSTEPEPEGTEETPAESVDGDTEAMAKPKEGEEQDSSEKATENSRKKGSKKESGNNSEKDTEKDSEADEPETVTIVVRRGEVCREIAEELAEEGLVPDAEEFRKYMRDNGYDNLIRVGEFTFTVGMDQEEIAKILTTKPE